MTTTGQLLGTPAFMPPEQFTGAPIDHRTDLFALGVILYGMTTGEQPFSGETLTAVSYKVVHTEPIPPSKLNPSIPPQLEARDPEVPGQEPGGPLPDGRGTGRRPGSCARRGLESRRPGNRDADHVSDGQRLGRNHQPGRKPAAHSNRLGGRTPCRCRAGTTVSAAPPVAPMANAAAPAGVAQAKTATAKPANKKLLLYSAAGVVVLAAAGAGAAFVLHNRAAATTQQASAPRAGCCSCAGCSQRCSGAGGSACCSASRGYGTRSQGHQEQAAHKPAAGTKAAAPPGGPTAVATPPTAAAPAPAPAPARPAPAPLRPPRPPSISIQRRWMLPPTPTSS